MADKIKLTEEIKRKIGALFMVGVPAAGVTEEYAEICKKYFLGNFVLNANHAESVENLCSVTSALRKLGKETQNEYPFIGIDQEGGWVTRFYDGAGTIPGAMSYAASGASSDKMLRVGRKTGRILRAMGCNVDNAPSIDINLNPENPIIGTRSYGDNVEQVTTLGVSFAKGLEEAGVLAACKHFPGHGNVHGDTHREAVVNNSSAEFLQNNDFAPFKKAIDEGIGALMTAHVTFTDISDKPATLSYEIMTKLLREQMGFEGITISDAMEMSAIRKHYPGGEASVRAIEAGCDQVLLYSYSTDFVKVALEAVYEAAESGRITEKRLDESIERISKQKLTYNIADAEPDSELANRLVFDEGDIQGFFEDKMNSVTCLKNDGVLDNLKNKKLLCIAPEWQLRRGVEEPKKTALSFSDVLGEVFADATLLAPEEALHLEGNYDAAVVGITGFVSNPIQGDIIKLLKKKGIPVVAILLSSPYEYRHVADCNAVVTCYEYTELSVRALTRTMEKNEYKGTLPMKLPV